jgi:hypothetical protein
MRFEKTKAQFLARTEHRPSLSRFIGRLRYPVVVTGDIRKAPTSATAPVIDNESQHECPRCDSRACSTRTTPAPASRNGPAVDWNLLAEPEARRLRELGLDEGVEVEMLHRSGFSAADRSPAGSAG